MDRHAPATSRRRRQGDRPRALRRRHLAARHAGGQGPAQPAAARAHRLDRHLQGRGAAGGQGRRHPRRLCGPALGVRPGRRDAGQLPRHGAQRHGAREGAVRGPPGRGGGGDQRQDRQGGAEADRGRVRAAAARDRGGRGDGGRRAAPARGHVHRRRRARPRQALERRQAGRVRARRHRGRLRAGRHHHRAHVRHQARAPGLHRAARLYRQLLRGRPGGAVVQHAGPFHRARPLRQDARHGRLEAARHRVRDRRRLRRQDRGLSRAAGARALAQGASPGQDGDEPRGGVPGDRPDVRRQRLGQGRRDQKRADHRRRGGAQVPGRARSRAAPCSRAR